VGSINVSDHAARSLPWIDYLTTFLSKSRSFFCAGRKALQNELASKALLIMPPFIIIIMNSINTLQGELGICNYATEHIASTAAKGLKQFTIIRKEHCSCPTPRITTAQLKLLLMLLLPQCSEVVLFLSLPDFFISHLRLVFVLVSVLV
jgi:hypothetical protein